MISASDAGVRSVQGPGLVQCAPYGLRSNGSPHYRQQVKKRKAASQELSEHSTSEGHRSLQELPGCSISLINGLVS